MARHLPFKIPFTEVKVHSNLVYKVWAIPLSLATTQRIFGTVAKHHFLQKISDFEGIFLKIFSVIWYYQLKYF